MAIQAGENTFYQANRGIVQNGLVLNLDAAVDASYNSGNTWRDLAADNNLTLYNSPEFKKDYGGEFYFDGTDEYGEFGSLDITGGNNYTITVITSRDYSTGSNRYLLDDSQSTSGFGIRIPSGSSHRLQYFAYDSAGGSAAVQTRNNVFTSSSVYHLTFIFRTSYIDSYINGGSKLSTSAIPNNIKTSSASMRLAVNSETGAERWLGKIYSVRIYNRVLSDAEVLQNYNAMRHRFGI